MKYLAFILALFLLATAVGAATSGAVNDPRTRINLLIIVDGLRPDYITPQLMPNLHRLGERGVIAERHSAAFPSVTRVNSATISTGTSPSRHGLMHNRMLVRGFSDEAFSTGSARTLRRLARFADGRLLMQASLAELLDENRMRVFVTGSGGSGNALLQNPASIAGMEVWTARGFFVPPEARGTAVAAIGDLTDDQSDRTVWAFNAYLHKALDSDPPQAVIMWISEPDSAGHRHGVGAPETRKAAANVDAQIGRILDAHAEHGLSDRVNILVTSDHGYSTNAGGFSVVRTLRESGIDANDVMVVSNMIFLVRDDPELLTRIVEGFQHDPATGSIYTREVRPGSSQGSVPGTLSTSVIQWNHNRAADVLVSAAWSNEVNEFGFAGTSSRGGKNKASHGSDSPYDLHIPLIAAGPDFRGGLRSRIPTGNVDLAPTILHLLGVEPPSTMSGRVLDELLTESGDVTDISVEKRTHRSSVLLDDGLCYVVELDTLTVASTTYLSNSRTSRHNAKEEEGTIC